MAQTPEATPLESAFIDWTSRTFPELAKGDDEVDRSLALGLIAAALIGPVPSMVITEQYRDFRVNLLLRFFPRSGRRQLEQEIPRLQPRNLAQFIALRLLDNLPPAFRTQDALPMLLEHPEALERSLGEIWCDHPHWVEWHGAHPEEGSVQADLAAQLRELQDSFDTRWPGRVEAAHRRMEQWLADTDSARPLAETHRILALTAGQADWRPFDPAIRQAEAKAAVKAAYHYGEVGASASDASESAAAFAALETWGERLDALCATPAFVDDPAIRLHEAMAAVYAIGSYGKAGAAGQDGAFAALERWGQRFDAMLINEATRIDPLRSDPTIRLHEARAAVNAIGSYGTAGAAGQDGAFAALERWGQRFDAMLINEATRIDALRSDPAIRLHEAKAAVNAIDSYGGAGAAGQDGAFDALERWGQRFDAMLINEATRIDALRSDPAIRLHEAMATFNAINNYGRAGAAGQDGAFAALERWGQRFDAMLINEATRVDALRSDPAIRLEEARAAANAIGSYGTAGAAGQDGAFDALEQWGHRFDAMLIDKATRIDALRSDPAIRLHEARAAVNAIGSYGTAGAAGQDGAFDALERWGQRFDAMLIDKATRLDALRSDPAIRLHEAKAAVYAIGSYGTAGAAGQDGAFAALERWGQRFDAMLINEATRIDALRSDPAIRLHEAKAAVNAIGSYGTAGAAGQDGAFAALERWGQRFDAMLINEATRIDALRSDPAIRLEEAKAASNASISYRKAGDDVARPYWFGRLARLIQLFPYRADFGDLASEANLSLAEQEKQGWPFGKVEWAEDDSVRTLIEPRLGTIRPDYAKNAPAAQPAPALTTTAPQAAPHPTDEGPTTITPLGSRNAPCPCGSGKRYKQCHGALGNG
ncbi:MAG: SEC-C domain-containing protein [Erythrobacter sp.]|nr:MAG: SEC-C domain-containing protein [Erythrobacter sp.]